MDNDQFWRRLENSHLLRPEKPKLSLNPAWVKWVNTDPLPSKWICETKRAQGIGNTQRQAYENWIIAREQEFHKELEANRAKRLALAQAEICGLANAPWGSFRFQNNAAASLAPPFFGSQVLGPQ